jgi:hypothetical protein
MIPFFVEIKKFRLKKNRDDNIIKQTVLINKSLLYNLKLKRTFNTILKNKKVIFYFNFFILPTNIP